RDLVRAIQEVLNGMMSLSPRVSRTVVQAYLAKSELPPDPLTPREREVLQLVTAGKTTKQVAARPGTSGETREGGRLSPRHKREDRGVASHAHHAEAGHVEHRRRRPLRDPPGPDPGLKRPRPGARSVVAKSIASGTSLLTVTGLSRPSVGPPLAV